MYILPASLHFYSPGMSFSRTWESSLGNVIVKKKHRHMQATAGRWEPHCHRHHWQAGGLVTATNALPQSSTTLLLFHPPCLLFWRNWTLPLSPTALVMNKFFLAFLTLSSAFFDISSHFFTLIPQEKLLRYQENLKFRNFQYVSSQNSSAARYLANQLQPN